MEYKGLLRVAYLPARVEGRYTFADYSGKETVLPVWIAARDGSWELCCGEECGLYSGDISLGRRHPISLGSFVSLLYKGRAYIIFVDKDDNAFCRYRVKDGAEISVGRDPGCTIVHSAPSVSKRHASLRFEQGRWQVRDENSVNGVYLNGRYCAEEAAGVGDVVFVMGLHIILSAEYIAVNNVSGRFGIDESVLTPAESADSSRYLESSDTAATEIYSRQPRRRFKIDPQPISVSMPPVRMTGNRTPLYLRMASPLLMGGRSIASGNALMAVSSMVLPMLTQGYSEKDRKEYEDRRIEKYSAYLEEKEKEIIAERDQEGQILSDRYPSIDEIARFTEKSDRLWERRDIDEDFLNIRIGTGKVPLAAEISCPGDSFELDQDPLKARMNQLVKRDYSIHDAPVMLSLKETYVVGLRGNTQSMYQMARNMILQLVFTHSYDEVKIVVLGDVGASQEAQWDFNLLRYIPHCWDDGRGIRLLATDKSSACVIGEHLKKRYEDAIETRKPLRPAYVVFALSRRLFDCVEIFNDILANPKYAGVSIVTGFEVALKESQKLIQVRKGANGREGNLVDLFSDKSSDRRFDLEAPNAESTDKSLRKLSRIRLRVEGGSFALPSTYTFLQMFGAGKVEYLNPLTRWKENNPTKSLAAPVGIGTDGELFYLDLHQKRQGPHGLVAGTTGSGKSEWIITYVLSLAVSFSPDEVAFVLIDYKGGGLASAFVDKKRGIHLPHVVGTITNLDGNGINRSMLSINSELKRRQAAFNEAKSKNNSGSMDIYEYQKLYRAGKVDDPMPHLFIIADEFAEMKSQQPEFMDELISTARIGRSLGVHLILATQKPSGVVNEQIWSNTRFRVCLKVAGRSDSMEMLKRPEAADIRQTGRFYLQVGNNEFFALAQSAWCGADYLPSDVVEAQKDEAVEFVDDAGQVTLKVAPPKSGKKTDLKQLVAVVQYLSDLAKQEGIDPKQLWIDALPEKQEYDELNQKYPFADDGGIRALIGEIDDPERQSRYPFDLDMLSFSGMMLIGSAASGKSNLLKTMLYSLVTRYGPDQIQYYILDMSRGALNPFKNLPHCGAYVTEQDENDFDRMVTMLKEIAAERKKLFEEADITTFNAYRKYKPMPLILFVLDGYNNIGAFNNGVLFNQGMNELMREISAYGIHLIVAANHTNEIYSRARSEMNYNLALQARDKYEYTDILGAKTIVTPPALPGRGMCVYEDRVLEYHTAMKYADLPEQEAAAELKKEFALLSERYADKERARTLPLMDKEEKYEDFCRRFKPGRIPLGYLKQTIKPVALPFKQLQTLGVYLGDKACVKPVIKNLIYACEVNKAKLTFVRKRDESAFDPAWLEGLSIETEVIGSSKEEYEALVNSITDECKQQNVFRDEYCEEHGLPSTDKKRVIRAADYIRSKTEPHIYLFESFADVCQSGINNDALGMLSFFFTAPWGYNIYFIGCFYPEDQENLYGDKLVKEFCYNQLVALFGGRFEQQCIHNSFSSSSKAMTKPLEDQAEFVLKYRGESVLMRMPCGVPEEETVDPDEASIL
ncbi:MAG: type VII secretion protein EssC [Clostridiales bacterium]|nr:type VII secretion protein EssC [Clostridiales bacterium]